MLEVLLDEFTLWTDGGCSSRGETDSRDTYEGSGRRKRGFPSYPTSTAIPQQDIRFSVNVLLPVVFVDPLMGCLSCYRAQAGLESGLSDISSFTSPLILTFSKHQS